MAGLPTVWPLQVGLSCLTIRFLELVLPGSLYWVGQKKAHNFGTKAVKKNALTSDIPKLYVSLWVRLYRLTLCSLKTSKMLNFVLFRYRLKTSLCQSMGTSVSLNSALFSTNLTLSDGLSTSTP